MTDKEKLDIALRMLAEWVVAIDENGGGWDYWDDYYKEAAYRPNPIREDLDRVINSIKGT